MYSCLKNPMDRGAWWAAVHGVAKSRTWLNDFTFTFHFHALEKEMATHSSVLAWRVPGTAEPGGLPSMGSHRVGHDWSDLAASFLTIHAAQQCFYSANSDQHMLRTRYGTTDWFQIGKGVCQGCILSPCLFNLYTEYIMWNARLDESQAGIKIAGRNITSSDVQMIPL